MSHRQQADVIKNLTVSKRNTRKREKKKENSAQRRIKHIKILTDKRKAIIDKARRMYKTYLINSNSSHNTS